MKRNIYITALLALIVISGLSFTLPESVFLPYLLKRFNEYQQQNPEEKLYAHIDKPFYKPGDKIWISVYLREGKTMQPSELSNIVYAELIDPRGGIYQKINLKAIDGKANGYFLIDSVAPGGLYKLKAYTQWMLNSTGFIPFEKDIQVQKIIQPRLIWKLDFAKEAYGPGDTVTANINLKDLSNNPIVGSTLNFQVLLEGKEFLSSSIITDATGSFQVTFRLPEDLKVNDGILNLTLNHNQRTHALSRAIPIVLNSIDLQFMPEGGDYIANIESKIAFKALNEFGKPADVEGIITNSKGDKVATFSSFHQGMGAFKLKAAPNEVYTAKITKPSGIHNIYSLPQAKLKGIALAVDSCSNKTLQFSLKGDTTQLVHCIVHMRGEVIYSQTYSFKGIPIKESIKIEEWPAGIVHITLFDDFEKPFAERLIFVNPHKKMNVTITTDKQVYYPREKVQMTIRTADETGNPIPANLSVSVVNDKIVAFANDKQDNILTSLLLTSDLKGKVHEPSFYFKEDEPKAVSAIDYLLLTQGWRRFSWKTVLNGNARWDFPESYDKIRGQIQRNNMGIRAKVSLVDANRKKVATLKTSNNGRFMFTGIDSLSNYTIYAKSLSRKDKNIQIKFANLNFPANNFSNDLSLGSATFTTRAQGVKKQEVNNSLVLQPDMPVNNLLQGGGDFLLEDDETRLDELVVIGYGSQKRSMVTGSAVSIRSEEITGNQQDMLGFLQGRVAGLEVTDNSGFQVSSTSVQIRGTSSLSFSSEPLYIVDAVPVQNISMVSPSVINSIEVIKDPAATGIYGSRAANGVILITTKGHPVNYGLFRENKRITRAAVRYHRPFIQPTVEFYKPQYQDKDSVITKPDYRETILWQPSVKTNHQGMAIIEFCNSDEVTSFRTIAEGIGSNGLIGRGEQVHSIEKPVSIDATLPPYLVFGDRILIPVVMRNTTTETVTGKLTARLPKMLASDWPTDTIVTIKSGESVKVLIPARVKNIAAKDKIDIRFGDTKFKDRFVETVEVVKRGFPMDFSFSSRAITTNFSMTVADVIENSLSGKLNLYNDVTSHLMNGIESVLREPHGCFEQLSATTYPNIQILNYFKNSQQSNSDIENKAYDLIQKGYKKLTTYETKSGGFEWFGHSPPHEGLTAYGLMLFTDMAQLSDMVDPMLIERTKQYLLSRKDEKGGFRQNNGKYGFSGASPKVTNAYIVMALSHAGVPYSQYQKEFLTALSEVNKSKDTYRMAVMAQACLNMKDTLNATILVDYLVDRIRTRGIKSIDAEQTIVNSYGQSKQVETVSLIADALIRLNHNDFETITTVVDFILSKRQYGGFGSTQATVLALKAVIGYSNLVNQINEDCTMTLILNNQEVAVKQIKAGSQSVTVDSLQNFMSPGLQNWEVRFSGNTNPIPFTMDINWHINTPVTSDECQVNLETKLMQNRCKVGDLVRMSVQLRNKKTTGLPMTLAMIGIPSGLTIQPWQLKEMQEKHQFDYYEIHKNYLVIYYREMGPNQTVSLNFDLKAEVAGTYEAPAGNAYLYYNKEVRDWEKGEVIEIAEK